ncbi:MAG: HAMP domain-containing histidine kinase [Lachnospiraceae bacterium]|jgi:signal transduction histidine kinase|nr:HAMP domain-containing histidine kinase [Lachnospiraceae bacterium]MCI9134146.1 HAMP domain-containing histidine kinase [Lachnospiraceae bacterium]
MKQFLLTLKRYAPWLSLLLTMDAFSALLLWLSDAKAFETLMGIILLASLILFFATLWVVYLKEQRKRALFQAFLTEPDGVHAEKLLGVVSQQERQQLLLLASILEEQQNQVRDMVAALQDYEEYVEGWVHEAKTPLSLLAMILDNRADQLCPSLLVKLNYVRSQLQQDITQMLYYARLGSSTKDYRFEAVNLSLAWEEVLEDYAPLLEEKQFLLENRLQGETVYTDRRGLEFMLGQILSNSIKYCDKEPKLTISLQHTNTADILILTDNGIGVKGYDLPYIFQKGFTGDAITSGKKATGMGLYLTKKMADDLNLHLEADSQWGNGFSISIRFPKV